MNIGHYACINRCHISPEDMEKLFVDGSYGHSSSGINEENKGKIINPLFTVPYMTSHGEAAWVQIPDGGYKTRMDLLEFGYSLALVELIARCDNYPNDAIEWIQFHPHGVKDSNWHKFAEWDNEK